MVCAGLVLKLLDMSESSIMAYSCHLVFISSTMMLLRQMYHFDSKFHMCDHQVHVVHSSTHIGFINDLLLYLLLCLLVFFFFSKIVVMIFTIWFRIMTYW